MLVERREVTAEPVDLEAAKEEEPKNLEAAEAELLLAPETSRPSPSILLLFY